MSEGMRQLLEEARETGFESGQRELLLKLILKRSERGDTAEEIAEYLDIRTDEVLMVLDRRLSDLQS